MAKVVFKKDQSNQLMLLPPDLGSFIPGNHLVRTVDKVINELKLSGKASALGSLSNLGMF